MIEDFKAIEHVLDSLTHGHRPKESKVEAATAALARLRGKAQEPRSETGWFRPDVNELSLAVAEKGPSVPVAARQVLKGVKEFTGFQCGACDMLMMTLPALLEALAHEPKINWTLGDPDEPTND